MLLSRCLVTVHRHKIEPVALFDCYDRPGFSHLTNDLLVTFQSSQFCLNLVILTVSAVNSLFYACLITCEYHHYFVLSYV